MGKYQMALCFVALFSAAALAEQEINFTGEISGQSCAINHNASATTVNLGKVPIVFFNNENYRTDPVFFDIVLSGCQNDFLPEAISMTANEHIGNGHLIVNRGTAKGVTVVVEDPIGGSLPVDGTPVYYQLVADENGEVTLPYKARMLRELGEQLSAGTVSASLTYDLIYR